MTKATDLCRIHGFWDSRNQPALLHGHYLLRSFREIHMSRSNVFLVSWFKRTLSSVVTKYEPKSHGLEALCTVCIIYICKLLGPNNSSGLHLQIELHIVSHSVVAQQHYYHNYMQYNKLLGMYVCYLDTNKPLTFHICYTA